MARQLGEKTAALAKGQRVHVHGELHERSHDRTPTEKNAATEGHSLDVTASEFSVAP